MRLAESFFCATNTDKYFVQLYGESGHNGKTTLFRILHTGFGVGEDAAGRESIS